MGGKFSSDRSFGEIVIRTERGQYEAGEQINGAVELRLTAAFPSNQLHLGFTAGERVSVVMAGGGGADASGERVAVHTDTHSLFELRFPLFAAAGESFEPGQHSFPFVFKLREDLPGSLTFGYQDAGQEGGAGIVYTVWAGLRNEHTGAAFFAEKELVVAQKLQPGRGARRLNFTRQLRGYCCAPLGQLALHCQLDCDKIVPGGQTLLSVGIDNSACRAALKAVQFRLVQTVQMRTGDGKAAKTVRRVAFSQTLPGCAAGEKIENVQAPLVQMGAGDALQPSTNGTLVSNDWCFELEPEFDAFLCCDQQPPHTIEVSVAGPSTEAPPPPAEDWAPTAHPLFVCTESPDHLFSLRNAP